MRSAYFGILLLYKETESLLEVDGDNESTSCKLCIHQQSSLLEITLAEAGTSHDYRPERGERAYMYICAVIMMFQSDFVREFEVKQIFVVLGTTNRALLGCTYLQQ